MLWLVPGDHATDDTTIAGLTEGVTTFLQRRDQARRARSKSQGAGGGGASGPTSAGGKARGKQVAKKDKATDRGRVVLQGKGLTPTVFEDGTFALTQEQAGKWLALDGDTVAMSDAGAEWLASNNDLRIKTKPSPMLLMGVAVTGSRNDGGSYDAAITFTVVRAKENPVDKIVRFAWTPDAPKGRRAEITQTVSLEPLERLVVVHAFTATVQTDTPVDLGAFFAGSETTDEARQMSPRRSTCYGTGVSRRPVFQHFDRSQLRITRVAMILLFALVGVSLVYAMQEAAGKARMVELFVPYTDAVWRDFRVWTLVTGSFIELRIFSLMFQGLMIWLMLPALERWWGPKRFLLFVGATAFAGTVAGTLMGFVTGRNVPIVGLDPTLFASAIAFGILYARQPIQFFGVLPMTGRQFMYGMMALVAVFILIGQEWEEGAAMGAAMLVAAGLTSGKLDPIATWRRWRYERARAHLSVVSKPDGAGGGSSKRKRRGTDERYLN